MAVNDGYGKIVIMTIASVVVVMMDKYIITIDIVINLYQSLLPRRCVEPPPN